MKPLQIMKSLAALFSVIANSWAHGDAVTGADLCVDGGTSDGIGKLIPDALARAVSQAENKKEEMPGGTATRGAVVQTMRESLP
jgi:hypothetical protein